ncbi:magnesium transporter MgtE N-terminal domain-containing protein [Niveispirillum sp. KHB5.9]|uniref:MotE family protein n=1 Tax=Niveispirillum sp. KHB5.9 TaxID=3400269 RepID=UPI003A84CFB1
MTDAPTQPAAKPTPKPAAKAASKPGAKPAARKAPPKPAKPKRALMRPGLLPATIFVATLVLGFKVGDIWLTVTTGKGLSLIPASVAEETVPQGLPETRPAATPVAKQAAVPSAPALTPPPTQVAEAPQEHQAPATPPAAGEHAPATQPPADANSPAPSGTPGQGFTPTEVELLQRLQERREQLDSRGRELDQREAMLTAAETRFDQKITELQNLKKEIQGLLTQANAEQQAQLDSLVKIYETMKPADAAKIFNNLENNVLLNVISRMKEAKVAPVFAAMDEKRAQEVTILLAARKRLPTVPE